MSTMLIKNGRVIDGTGAASINADASRKNNTYFNNEFSNGS